MALPGSVAFVNADRAGPRQSLRKLRNPLMARRLPQGPPMRVTVAFLSLWFIACLAPGDGASGDRELTSVEGSEHVIEWDGFVYVPYGASDDHIRWEIQRQIKSSLGALREVGIGIKDRDAQRNLDPAGWTRTTLTVVDGGAPAETLERVTYRYTDTALVDDDEGHGSTVPLTLLFGDYAARRDELVPACSDDASAAADSLWYHYSPRRWACRNRITAERDAIAAATAALPDAGAQIARVDRDRRFLETLATLTPVADAPVLYPEYDRLWGFTGNTSRTKLVVYAFFGVDKDEADPRDYGLREYLRFQRTLRARFPELRVTHTEPHAWLLDFWIDGHKLDGIDFGDVERWILDGTGFPAQVGSDAGKRAQLLGQVIERFSERWIYWSLPVEVTDGTTTRQMTVEIRSFYGYEDGSWEVRQRARWRYLEAFWHGDVFAYTGHSHFGHGPLEPGYYHAGNFPDRYQVMLVNSCLSFNYYDQDFLDIHPGGSANLDIVVNGLAAYWHGMGEATAKYVLSLIDGQDRSWRELLTEMRVDLPWHWGYDPLRAVNGELDNLHDAAARPLEVTPL